MAKVYISGPITGTENYMERFEKAEKELTDRGYSVINPAKVNAQLPDDTTYEEYMKMSLIMLDMCDTIYMLRGWEKSKGSCAEYEYSKALGKNARFEEIDLMYKRESERDEFTVAGKTVKNFQGSGVDVNLYHCANCGRPLQDNKNNHYCPRCGCRIIRK